MTNTQKSAKKTIFGDPKKIPFFSHFNELRKRVTNYAIVLFALSFLFYWRPIYDIIMEIFFRDVLPNLPDGAFALTGMFDAMTFRFTVGLYGALIVTSPLLVYHILAFFAPAIKKRERKWIFPAAAAAAILFVTGVVFAYFVILPITVEFLLGQHSAYTFEVPRAQDWLAGVSLLLLAFGVSFQLPLVIFALIGLGIVKYPIIRESWRTAYILLFVLAALVTPDRGPISMLALAGALIVLYEGGLIAARFFLAQRVDEQYVELYHETLLEEGAPNNKKKRSDRIAKLKKQADAAQKRIDARRAKNPRNDDDEPAMTNSDTTTADEGE